VAVASAQDRDGGFVARSFKGKNCFHNRIYYAVILIPQSREKNLTTADNSRSINCVIFRSCARSLSRRGDLGMTK
jgi:hypothetical protein